MRLDQAGKILERSSIQFRVTFFPVNNGISACSENSTDWKSAVMEFMLHIAGIYFKK